MTQYIRINNFEGGQADSELIGLKNSYAESVGLDIHSEPRVLKVNQALKKDSGTTVTDFCQVGLLSSNGNTYWFGDTGKIYKRTSAGVWSVVGTNANGAIVGACEFKGYIYYASTTQLGRFDLATETLTDSWKTLTSATWHPMIVWGLYLLIGNNRTIASVDDAGTFTANGTPDITFADLSPQYQIKSLCKFGIDILIGTTVNSNFTFSSIFRWDGVSPTYIANVDIPGNSVNALIPFDNYVFAQVGDNGNIWYYDGTNLELFRKIKGDYNGKSMTVYPFAVSNFKGHSIFGVSNLSNNPCLEGIYSIGRYNRNYPTVLNLEYVPSPDVMTGLLVGAIVVSGTTLLVGWKNTAGSGTYGIDVIDANNKYKKAYYKSLIIAGGDRSMDKVFTNYVVSYKSLPTGTALSLSADTNYAGTFAHNLALINDTDAYKYRCQKELICGAIQFKIDFTTKDNSAPEMEELTIFFDTKKIL